MPLIAFRIGVDDQGIHSMTNNDLERWRAKFGAASAGDVQDP